MAELGQVAFTVDVNVKIEPCPKCGYCPHCGRANERTWIPGLYPTNPFIIPSGMDPTQITTFWITNNATAGWTTWGGMTSCRGNN